MNRKITSLFIWLALSVMMCAATNLWAQDPVKLAPGKLKIILENDTV